MSRKSKNRRKTMELIDRAELVKMIEMDLEERSVTNGMSD